jgi:hypothetical protein
MSTLDEDDLWEFNVASEQWTQLTTTGVKPTQRSFHVLTQANVSCSFTEFVAQSLIFSDLRIIFMSMLDVQSQVD